jgi:hypothetical protein
MASVTAVTTVISEALDLAQKLECDAEWLEIETSELLAKLEAVAKHPAACQHLKEMLTDAQPAVVWIDNATSQLFDQYAWLIRCLFDCAEALKEAA